MSAYRGLGILVLTSLSLGACAAGSETSSPGAAGSGAGGASDGGAAGHAEGGTGGSNPGGTGGTGETGGTGATGGSSGAGGTAGTSGGGGTAGMGGVAGTGGTAGAGGSADGGAGGSWLPYPEGCADGTREGFADVMAYPFIAACDGAWSVPGIFEMPAMCNREAGNNGVNSQGTGCTTTDLCAPGWRVCYGRDDVLLRHPSGCDGVMTGATSPVFFTTQMSSTGAFECSTTSGATNDLFGCGDLGCDFSSNTTVQQLCAPLSRTSHDLCKGLRNDGGCGDWCNHLGKYPQLSNTWYCGTDTEAEALNVVKTGIGQGGVLCCVDDTQ